jgi:hypothetical protein
MTTPDSGVCELAETTLGDDRLLVWRVHLHAQNDQAKLPELNGSSQHRVIR